MSDSSNPSIHSPSSPLPSNPQSNPMSLPQYFPPPPSGFKWQQVHDPMSGTLVCTMVQDLQTTPPISFYQNNGPGSQGMKSTPPPQTNESSLTSSIMDFSYINRFTGYLKQEGFYKILLLGIVFFLLNAYAIQPDKDPSVSTGISQHSSIAPDPLPNKIHPQDLDDTSWMMDDSSSKQDHKESVDNSYDSNQKSTMSYEVSTERRWSLHDLMNLNQPQIAALSNKDFYSLCNLMIMISNAGGNFMIHHHVQKWLRNDIAKRFELLIDSPFSETLFNEFMDARTVYQNVLSQTTLPAFMKQHNFQTDQDSFSIEFQTKKSNGKP